MDNHVTMDRRFTLNMTHLSNPIAESTCVNLNGTATTGAIGERSNGAVQFRWGGSPISPKNRSNSITCLNNNSAMHKSRSTATQRARMNLSKIDPRVYADVQSRGLVSRIVQYHENGARLNRSMSAGNLYSKSGQSSIAQLQKTELPYRATQQNVSITRIAPPKKSVFYGNTLSSLLRSNSVISVQKSDEEISCENRPILHPPPTENELAPTRSVLDVLKEISRKRINSDDADGIHDTNKKYCNQDCNDSPYEQPAPTGDLMKMGMHSGLVTSTMTTAVQSYKRQREHIVAPQEYPLHYTQNSVTSGTTVKNTNSPKQTQRSPEQTAKKRLCSYNNDITSSLSSSLIHANKRKFYEQQRSSIQNSSPSRVEEYETQKSKIQRQQCDLRFQQVAKSLSCTPIVPVSTIPLSQSDTMMVPSKYTEKTSEISAETTDVLKRTVSEPPLVSSKIYSKPKITLFNRNYNESGNSNQMNRTDEAVVENSTNLDEGECADIQFVKPKKSSAIINKKNPLIERTQKSKLAMMLSGLRGEIYQGEEGDDEVDKLLNKMPDDATKQIKPIGSKENTASKVSTTSSSTATTSTTSTVTNFTMKAPNKSVITPPDATVSTKLVPNTTVKTINSPTSSATASSSTSSLATSPTMASSTLGGFKLTPSANTQSSAATTNVSPSTSGATAKSTSPLVGIKLTPQKATLNFANTNIAAPTFNFNATSTATTEGTKSVAGTIATGIGAVPQLQGFSFGAPIKSTTSSDTATNATLTTTAPTSTSVVMTTATITKLDSIDGFKFGATKNPELSTGAPTVTAPTAFASFAATVASTSSQGSTEAPKQIFTFGTAPTSTPAGIVKPTFNFGGSATPAVTTTVASNTFTFGAAAKTTTATSASAPPTAGQVTTAAPQTLSLFGGGATNNAFTAPTSSATKPIAFGAASMTTQTTTAAATNSTFSFGSVATATTNSGTLAGAATNLFSFGGQKSTTATSTATATIATPFSFSAGTQNTPTTVNTTNANTNKPVFSFGGVGESGVNPLGGATKTNSSSGNLFAFGSAPAASDSKLFGNNSAGTNSLQAAAPTTTQPGTFTFGAVAGQGATPAFGASVTSSTPTFGVTSISSTTPFSFAANNAQKSASAPSAGPTTAAPAGGFSFGTATTGAATSSNTPSSNIFGSATAALPNQTAPASNTGMAKPAFNFGGTSTNITDASKSIFGGATTNAGSTTSGNNTFSALAAASSNQTNKSFSFGASTAISNNAAPNPFAAATSKPAAGGFSFSATTAANKAVVSPPTLASNATQFAFGGTANSGSAASTSAAPFSFGSTNSDATTNKTFTFGSSGNIPAALGANASSIFGGAAQGVGNSQQTPAPAFSFSAGTSTAATPAAGAAPSAVANIFAAPGGISSGAAERPIRRATRRLQKT
ncbi:mucin-5AC isoform X2 [Anastrepha obliqua]|uniref:mucin-5AC isoform X2 n=1 Tax=Anastrepha obliqua TaxID=95512 RepID=UPI002409FA62|nr:mucin-5AC isoform X2 [Anastrepha obliqua]